MLNLQAEKHRINPQAEKHRGHTVPLLLQLVLLLYEQKAVNRLIEPSHARLAVPSRALHVLQERPPIRRLLDAGYGIALHTNAG